MECEYGALLCCALSCTRDTWHVSVSQLNIFISSRLFSRTDFYPAKEMHRAAILQVIWMDSNVVTTCRRALQCRTAITLSKNVLVCTELTWFILSYLRAYTQTIYLFVVVVFMLWILQWAKSHSCPRAALCPLHACAGANCLHYLDISYLRWRAVRPGSRGPGCCWSNCSSCWISLHLNICAGPWVLVVCKSKQSLVIGYGRRGNHRQKGTN